MMLQWKWPQSRVPLFSFAWPSWSYGSYQVGPMQMQQIRRARSNCYIETCRPSVVADSKKNSREAPAETHELQVFTKVVWSICQCLVCAPVCVCTTIGVMYHGSLLIYRPLSIIWNSKNLKAAFINWIVSLLRYFPLQLFWVRVAACAGVTPHRQFGPSGSLPLPHPWRHALNGIRLVWHHCWHRKTLSNLQHSCSLFSDSSKGQGMSSHKLGSGPKNYRCSLDFAQKLRCYVSLISWNRFAPTLWDRDCQQTTWASAASLRNDFSCYLIGGTLQRSHVNIMPFMP